MNSRGCGSRTYDDYDAIIVEKKPGDNPKPPGPASTTDTIDDE